MSESGWTNDTLYVHFSETIDQLRGLLMTMAVERDIRYQQLADSQAELTQAALTSTQIAVDKAEAATEKRFESVNEFRAQLSDQAASFMVRKEYELGFRALSDRMEALIHTNSQKIEALADTFQEKLDSVQLARNDLFSLLNDRVNSLSITQGSHSGETLGSARTLGYVISFLMVAAALGSLISYVITH